MTDPSLPHLSAPADPVITPSDEGIAALPVDQILAPHAALLDRIRICYGVDMPSFEHDILPVVRGYAAYVHLLPATADNYFSAPGGLLQLGLEVAFFALQGTDAHIFSGRATITTRRHLEPRWRLATFIAGLCCEIHGALNQLTVASVSGRKWPSCVTPLAQWVQDERIERYRIGWQANAPTCRATGVFAVRLVLPPETLQHLAEGNAVVVPHLLASISGMPLYGQHNVLDDLVRRATAVVIDRHLRERAERSGSPTLGRHLGDFLVNAMRRLVASNAAWTANTERSRIWHSSEGLFAVWPGAAHDIRKLFDADQMPGMPREPQAMLDALLIAGVAQSQEDGTALWSITPPGAKAPVEAMKLSSSATLYASPMEPPSPLGPLLGPSSADAKAQSRRPAEQASASASASVLSLASPLRLDVAVRKALDDIVAGLNAGIGAVTACGVPTGLFVPLTELQARGVQTPQAIRALSDVRMLAPGDTPMSPLAHLEIDGDPVSGLIIATRHVSGLTALLSTPKGEGPREGH
jgi:conjugal transfer pilus assembly protein TraI